MLICTMYITLNFLTRQTAEIESLLVNMVCFHLSLSGCGSGDRGNMHPCNFDV